jgi:uncharacterized membrane protein YfcA
MTWESWQWAVAVFAALCVGVSKTGVYGLAPLFIACFAMLLPAKQATGVVLPLLICGDVVAVLSYRGHAQWRYLWRLFPWTAAGVVLGWLALNRIDDRQAKLLIGTIILGLVAMYLLHRARPEGTSLLQRPWFGPVAGVLAGFTTLVANAAGPLMTLYLLAIGLPKMEFMGTGSVFFLLLNLFKVPFISGLGLITTESLKLNLLLAPAVLAGTWVGRRILTRMDQRVFEYVALGLSALGGLKMLFF